MEILVTRTPAALAQPDTKTGYNPLKDHFYVAGLGLIVLSTSLFLVPLIPFFEVSRENDFGFFCLHFLMAIGYGATLFFNKRLRLNDDTFQRNIGYVSLSLVLDLVSCYALNRSFSVFQEATTWLSVYVIIACVTFIGFGFRDMLSRRGQLALYFLLGMSLFLLTYLAIYLVPLYGFGLVGILALGLGLHAFFPLISVIYLGCVLVRAYVIDKKAFQSATVGILFPLLLAIPFLDMWKDIQEKITYTYNQTTLDVDDGTLPAWVRVSQRISDDWITERMLKTDLVYETPNQEFEFWGMPDRTNFEEQRLHDPLVMIASRVFGRLPLTREEKIKILEAAHDARHSAQERLWTGTDLRTANVTTNVRLFPESRIAYTEQTFNIHNTLTSRWSRPQEAIYTFHLPEGAVVTSLSLWINGKEEKGYLTTKGKAIKAYKTIVGVESRDPSVVHWQEGNEVSVRVFPCTPEEDRRFKVGITAPLRVAADKLVYSSIYFNGPTAIGATESVRVQVQGNPVDVELPTSFTSPERGVHTREGDYWPDWEMSLPLLAAKSQAFSFEGRTYQTEPYAPAYAPFDALNVYLDLNNSWTKREMEQVWELVKTRQVYVFDRQLIRLTEENKDELFDRLGDLRFSLFPFYEIREPERSLVVSKSTLNAPNLRDLKDSDFSKNLRQHLNQKPQIRLYNLSRELSPYLKTLKEFRVLVVDQGDVPALTDLLNKRQFLQISEDDHTVVIEDSRMRIRESVGQSETASVSNAPDHLLRLFAYNSILQNIGKDYFQEDYVNDELLKKAGQANVVSPVSSLIVLESVEDYQRFDISKSQNSLGNATAKSSGAVPEPHEWLLIALVVGMAGYLLVKTYL